MKEIIIVNILHFIITVKSSAIFNTDYWTARASILRFEESLALGGSLRFENDERIANDILMDLKEKEIAEAFSDPTKFSPARNFIEVHGNIEQSKIFDIIKRMPKGAVLHSHDTSIVSEDFVFNNITYRDNLFVCDDNGTLSLRFFDVPSNDCNWQLLQRIRSNKTMADEINSRIHSQLSMITADPDSVYSNVNIAWTKFMDVFTFITPMLTYKPIYEDHFYQGLKELYEDNVLYLELRSTLPPLYELNGTEYSPIEVLKIYKEVTTRFINDYPDFIGVKIIYAPIRVMTPEEIDTFVKSAVEMKAKFPNFFAGIDLVGQEDKGQPLTSYADKLFPIINNIQTFFHAGETNWYGMNADENLIDALLLNTKRIGHGYALIKHPFLLEMIKRKDIAIEICPISNQVLELVKDLRNHPASLLFADGFPVVISNDDPGLWGAKALSYDFYEAFMGLMSRNADIRALKQLAINSIKYSSMSNDQKLKANEIWTRKWFSFISQIICDSTRDLVNVSEIIQ
ncbi:hypothetical protein PV326_013908 [Microctonus aethiopoides]|uniref:Adenosine deaminase n=1 Tax=Microctonus aethiopoides TaxID=144406 RepID=A0AA39C5I1_9HYME|nr:hypothetical protein PV326_013908 [Microctonus aethiopoides]KAK0158274.1 hypothetical protein PV328_009298 [Microctonus aethiopoides]